MNKNKADEELNLEMAVNSILSATAVAAINEIRKLFNSQGINAKEAKRYMEPPAQFETAEGGSGGGAGGGAWLTVWDKQGNFAGMVHCDSPGQAHQVGKAAVANGAGQYAVSY